MKLDEQAARARAITALCSMAFTGEEPGVIGSALAELMATFLTNHKIAHDAAAEAHLRTDLLRMWCETVWQLVAARRGRNGDEAMKRAVCSIQTRATGSAHRRPYPAGRPNRQSRASEFSGRAIPTRHHAMATDMKTRVGRRRNSDPRPDHRAGVTPAPAETFAGVLMAMLADPNIPADKMEVVMKMRREVLGDQAREAFMQHFAELSAELPQVERDGTVELVKDGRSIGKYAFTTIENMDVILRPLLAKHGFAISFASTDNKGDSVTITGTLSGWGWERSSTYTLPPDAGPGRNALQARGSSRRYAKRYIVDDLCNVVRKGKDDDARGALEALIDTTQIKNWTN